MLLKVDMQRQAAKLH